MQPTEDRAPFSIERVPLDGATRDALEPLGLPADVLDGWARFEEPLIRTVLVARTGSALAGAVITVGRPLAHYLKIGGSWTSDRAVDGRLGRDGLASALVAAAEQFAWDSGFLVVKREGTVGPAPGYVTVEAPEIAGPIPDPGPVVPVGHFKWRTRRDQTTVPYMRQTTDFTCGPTALLMLMAHYGIIERPDRATELDLWRQATTIEACDPYGLAVAASRRGLRPAIVISTDATLFLEDLKTEQERALKRFVQDNFRHLAGETGLQTQLRAFQTAELADVVRAGGAAIVLVDETLVHGDRCPHWILVHGMEGDCFLAHDPWTENSKGESWVDGYDVPLSADALDRIAWTGEPRYRAMLSFTGPAAPGG